MKPATHNTSESIAQLQQRHQALVAQGRTDFTLRMHRALSWLQRAEDAGDDDDVAFICLWIAFNAAYAQDLPGYTEKDTFKSFMQQVCDLDRENLLYGMVWREFSGPIRVLLDNPYVFQPFWECWNSGGDEAQWRAAFDRAKAAAGKALARQDTAQVLFVVFQRLYTLRNQLMHGGATWGSSVNRSQVRDGRVILARVLPAMLALMMDAPERFQARPFYPVVQA
ncbi:HEPN domain-containing protein [Vandammella animalimorsus]|uniref:HEPN domain-containing protein n=1 Tax=Vandammella animalimorsus TaxID=2029117 RepID=UPI001EEDD029|nr:HEPN domain-containing protein [Vandammella animalimorsus]